MTTVSLSPVLKQQFLDMSSGVAIPAAAGYVYTYAAGTLTPQSTYTDYTGTTLNTNPILLDAEGRCDMWFDVTLNYKVLVYNSAMVLIYSEDNIPGAAYSGVANYATTAGTATTATTATQATQSDVTLVSANNGYALILAGASPSAGGYQTLQLNQYLTYNPSSGALVLPATGSISVGTIAFQASTGTQPFTVTSTTVVNNLHAQYAANMIGGAAGSIVCQSAANTTNFLSNGTAGQVLVSQGAGNPPVWGANGSVAYWSYQNPAAQNNGVVSWQSINSTYGISPGSGTVSTVTILTAGVYVLYASVTFTDSPGSSPTPQLIVKKNGGALGTQQASLYQSGGNPGGQVPVGGVSAVTRCIAGDMITVYWGSSIGGSLTAGLGTFTGFQIA